MLALIQALEMPLVPPTEPNLCLQARGVRTPRASLIAELPPSRAQTARSPSEDFDSTSRWRREIQLTVKAIGNPNIKPMTKEETIRIVKSFIYAAIWRIPQTFGESPK
jgi:hypothetical protein